MSKGGFGCALGEAAKASKLMSWNRETASPFTPNRRPQRLSFATTPLLVAAFWIGVLQVSARTSCAPAPLRYLVSEDTRHGPLFVREAACFSPL